jgi:hypothetical protein
VFSPFFIEAALAVGAGARRWRATRAGSYRFCLLPINTIYLSGAKNFDTFVSLEILKCTQYGK